MNIDKSSLAERMYAFFSKFDEDGAPSFTKFARREGLHTADIEEHRSDAEFERAYNECMEIRRDYLKDQALSKRFDASTVKFLLSEERGDTATDGDPQLELVLRVMSEENEA